MRNNNILRFDIPMGYLIFMQIFDSTGDLLYFLGHFGLGEGLFLL